MIVIDKHLLSLLSSRPAIYRPWVAQKYKKIGASDPLLRETGLTNCPPSYFQIPQIAVEHNTISPAFDTFRSIKIMRKKLRIVGKK